MKINKKLSNLSFIQGTRVSSVKSEFMELEFLKNIQVELKFFE